MKFKPNILNSLEVRESLGKISRKKLPVRHSHVGSAGISECVGQVLFPAADDPVLERPVEPRNHPRQEPPEGEAGIWFQCREDPAGSEERDHPVDGARNVLDVMKHVHADD